MLRAHPQEPKRQKNSRHSPGEQRAELGVGKGLIEGPGQRPHPVGQPPLRCSHRSRHPLGHPRPGLWCRAPGALRTRCPSLGELAAPAHPPPLFPLAAPLGTCLGGGPAPRGGSAWTFLWLITHTHTAPPSSGVARAAPRGTAWTPPLQVAMRHPSALPQPPSSVPASEVSPELAGWPWGPLQTSRVHPAGAPHWAQRGTQPV